MKTVEGNIRALVTGASSGLGVEFAHLLAAQGVDLVLADRGVDAMEELAAQLRGTCGVEVHVEGIDLAEPGAAQVLKQRLDRQGLRIDTLINNAGYGVHGEFLGADPARISAMLQLNVVTLTELTHLYGTEMAARGKGRILLVASLLGYMAAPSYAAYAATKAYIRSLGESLHDEFAPRGVTVTVLAPGLTATAFADVSGHKVSALLKMMMMQPRPVAEIGLRALMAGRSGVVPGVANTLAAWSARLMRPATPDHAGVAVLIAPCARPAPCCEATHAAKHKARVRARWRCPTAASRAVHWVERTDAVRTHAHDGRADRRAADVVLNIRRPRAST